MDWLFKHGLIIGYHHGDRGHYLLGIQYGWLVPVVLLSILIGVVVWEKK